MSDPPSALPGARAPINPERLLERFLGFLAVDSYRGGEDRMVAALRPILEPLGVTFRTDGTGNLFGLMPARDSNDAPLALNAHLDTIRPTAGMQPVVTSDRVSSDGSSVLGADDKAGVAAICEAVETIHASGLAHGEIELVFTIGEEVGHIGARALDVAEVTSRRMFVLDSTSPVGAIVTQASGRRAFRARFTGRAAHAGAHAEDGVSAIHALARAVARMPLGRVSAETVANIGTIGGGHADNIVAPEAELTGEARSTDEALLDAQIEAMFGAMDQAADEAGGKVDHEVVDSVRGYRLEPDNPTRQLAEAAIRSTGLESDPVATGGASDAHIFNAKGLSAACLGAGYRNVHSNDEYMPIEELRRLAQVAVELIIHTGSRTD